MNKAARQAISRVNIERVKAAAIQVEEQQEHVFRVNTPVGAILYYTSTNKWQYRGRVFHGSPNQFVSYAKKMLATVLTVAEAESHEEEVRERMHQELRAAYAVTLATREAEALL